MIRKYVVALSALTIPLGAFALGSTSSVAGAAVPHVTTVTFKGKITCQLSGHLHFAQVAHPTLGVEFTTKETIRLNLAATLSNCKGTTTQGGSTIVSGAVSGAITGSYSCASLLNGVPSPAGVITWTTKGKAATPTKIALSAGKLSLGPPPSVSYTTATTGSFAGTNGKATASVSQTASELLAACKTSPYLRQITINPTGSSGSI